MSFKQHYTEIVSSMGASSQRSLPKNCNLIIFGYSNLGRNFAETIRDSSTTLIAFADNNCSGFCEVHNVPIINPEKIKEQCATDDTIIVLGTLSTLFRKEMKDQLISLGISENNIEEFDSVPIITTSNFKKTHYDGYERTFDLLKDGISKNILLQRN